MPEPIHAGFLHRCGLAIATAGGAGLIRPAPGTWGSLVAALAGLGAVLGWGASAGPVLGALAVGATILGLLVLPPVLAALADPDPSQVVIDEVAGCWLAMALVPGQALAARPLLATALAFALFRLFDIAKPWPVSAAERLPGAWGVMADDLAAGLLAGIITAAVLH